MNFLVAHIPGKLNRKSVATAFWECELYEELVDLGVDDKWLFTKHIPDSPHNDLVGPKDAAAEYVVRQRTATTYDHECHTGCQNKGIMYLIFTLTIVLYILTSHSVDDVGCGKLYVLDGNWKLSYAHCMFPVPVTLPGYEGEINYPNVCPRNPEYQSAFCDRHTSVVKQKGIPTELRKFFIHCKNQKKGKLYFNFPSPSRATSNIGTELDMGLCLTFDLLQTLKMSSKIFAPLLAVL